jgi:hypothetical protein
LPLVLQFKGKVDVSNNKLVGTLSSILGYIPDLGEFYNEALLLDKYPLLTSQVLTHSVHNYV